MFKVGVSYPYFTFWFILSSLFFEISTGESYFSNELCGVIILFADIITNWSVPFSTQPSQGQQVAKKDLEFCKKEKIWSFEET